MGDEGRKLGAGLTSESRGVSGTMDVAWQDENAEREHRLHIEHEDPAVAAWIAEQANAQPPATEGQRAATERVLGVRFGSGPR